jgi:hypothetical protein
MQNREICEHSVSAANSLNQKRKEYLNQCSSRISIDYRYVQNQDIHFTLSRHNFAMRQID